MRLLLPIMAVFASGFMLAQAPPDFTPPTPLFAAVAKNNTAELKRLLAAGTNPNEGRMTGFTPLFYPIFFQNQTAFDAMLASGADVKALDMAGSSTLMWAAANEAGNPYMVEALIARGVNVNLRNKMGESAMDWALRRGNTAVVAALKKAGAGKADAHKAPVEKALALFDKSGPQFIRVSGCTSCHHQSLPQMARQLARERGYAVNETAPKQEVGAVVAMMKAFRPAIQAKSDQFPDIPISVPYILMGLYAEGYASDEITTEAVELVQAKQRADGSFASFPARPPMESSDITATALSLRAMVIYGKNMDAAIVSARKWLEKAKPQTTEELSMRLLGLAWGKADKAVITAAGRALLAEQRPEGGWAQLPAREADAYATGQALYALHQAGVLTTEDVSFERGAGYLLRTQEADGSWHVRTRAFPFQPLKDSGFPHGRDQWISASGTAWAAMALSLPGPQKATEISSAP